VSRRFAVVIGCTSFAEDYSMPVKNAVSPTATLEGKVMSHRWHSVRLAFFLNTSPFELLSDVLLQSSFSGCIAIQI